MLLMTVLMIICAAREANNGNYAMGATLALIPMCGWIAIMFGI